LLKDILGANNYISVSSDPKDIVLGKETGKIYTIPATDRCPELKFSVDQFNDQVITYATFINSMIDEKDWRNDLDVKMNKYTKHLLSIKNNE
jgi:hypothetical protein